jgi:phosphate transport system substrate-binding protein
MKKVKLIYFALVSIAFIQFGCKGKSFDEDVENLNKGALTIYADESYKTLLDELIQSYENIYPESDIIPTYGADDMILNAMLKDATRMMITGRTLTAQELEALEKVNGIAIKQFEIGREAIAVITSVNNPDSIFDYDEFVASRTPGYRGRYSNVGFVFNKKNSGMISDLLPGTQTNLNNLFSLENTDTLVAYIAANPQTFGFISFAEISDVDAPNAKKLLSANKVLTVAKADSTGSSIVTELSQSTIMTKKYPLLRSVNVVKGNTPQLLGTGFVNFLYRSKASRIMLKEGLIPANMTERKIEIVD